jgi:hypothetical protein
VEETGVHREKTTDLSQVGNPLPYDYDHDSPEPGKMPDIRDMSDLEANYPTYVHGLCFK